MTRRFLLCSYLACATLLAPLSLLAQLTISSPDSSHVRLVSPDDYATQVLNNPWDMDSEKDLADFIPHADIGSNLTNFSVSGGMLNFTIANADNAYFHLLSPGQCSTNPLGKNGQTSPIDSTKYRYLTVTMYTSVSSEFRVLWYTGCSYITNWVRITPTSTKIGWQTFTIDLQSASHESTSDSAGAWNAAPVTGLRIDPGYSGTVHIDSISLSAEAPLSGGTHALTYSATASGNDTRYSLFVDSDSNPFNGYADDLLLGQAASSNPAVNISSSALTPGTYKIVGFMSDDYATLRANPWEMSSSEDVFVPVPGSFSSTSFAGGTFSGTTANATDAHFFMNMLGSNIDASIYRCVSYNISLPNNTLFALIWKRASTGQTIYSSYRFSTVSSDYTSDLSGNSDWSGDISAVGLIVPSPNTSFSVSWMSARQGACASSDTTPAIVASAGNLVINQAPLINILQPDSKGGEDFASTVLGNPWNFDGVNDLVSITNLTTAEILPGNTVSSVYGNYFHGKSAGGSDDPYQTSLYYTAPNKNPDKLIDSSRYKNVWYKMLIDREQDVTNGSVVRIIWQSLLGGDTKPWNGDDQISFDGWNEYVQDMTNVVVEPILHPGAVAPYWRGNVNLFRIDPHEFSVATDYYLDFIRITADDESNTQFAIAYDLSDADSDAADVSVSLYYNSSATTSGGVLISGPIPLTADTRVVNFDTSNIAEGTYYVYAVATDGHNSTSRLATGRLVISHSRAQDSTLPNLALDLPVEGQTFADSLRVKGYAVDNVQIALVEVLLDDDLLGTVVPDSFHATAFQNYSQYAESANAGFNKTFNTSAITTGAHVLSVKAYDTAGNLISGNSLQVNLTRGAQSNEPTLTEDSEQTPITVPGTIGSSAKLGLKAKVSGSGASAKLQLTVAKTKKNCSGSTPAIYVSTNKSELMSAYTSGSTLKSKVKDKVYSAKLQKSTPTTLYAIAGCGEFRSGAVKISTKNGNGKKGLALSKWVSKTKLK